ncbi:MAG: carboxypeptidase-like regulatory domain-containing protein, partial [Bacteroidota bacterium]
MTSTFRWTCCIVMLFFFLLIHQTFAGTTGKIAGKVSDAETGEPIPYANIVIEGTTLGAAANLNGNYVILNVPPGVYTVVGSVIGFQKVRVTDARVSVDFTTTLDFKLEIGDIELPAIVVQGERNPLIRPDLTNPVAIISAETFQ